MPKVVVYVPADAWRAMEARGWDAAETTREAAKKGIRVALTEGGDSGVGQVGAKSPKAEPPPSVSAHVQPPHNASTDKPELIGKEHFKPDFKKGKK